MRKWLIAGIAGVLALAIGGIAVAGTKNDVTFETKYSKTKVGKPTGFKTNISGAPRDANGQLEPANRVVVTFQKGTKFDTSVPGRCTKQKVDQGGAEACPKNSIVGTGQAEATTGLTSLDPVRETITAINAKNSILFRLTGLQTVTLVGKLKGNKLTTDVPPFPVPGTAKGAVLTKFDLAIKTIRKGSKAYVTTPETCTGKWTVRADFFYPNVPPIRGVPSVTRCRRR